MHGLPERFDGLEFIGLELDQVSFASNGVFFGFGEVALVSVSGTYRYSLADAAPEAEEVVPPEQSSVLGLLGRVVASAEVVRPGNLVLRFSAGGSLTFIEDELPFESYAVRTPVGQIYV